MSEWREMRLEEVADVIGGGTPSTKISDYWNGDISWITPKDLSSHGDRYISRGERDISSLGLENSSAKLLPINSVLLSSRAPVGYVAISSQELTTNQGFQSLVFKKGHIPLFFYYLLKSKRAFIESHASGSTFGEVSNSVVRQITFEIPPLREQKAIAGVLSSFDDKIEHNRRMIETLEAMGKALFQSWFVNFDPVRAKAAGHPTELPNAISTLFPNELVSSQLGDIPKGWEVAVISNFGQVICGKTPPTKKVENFGGDYPFITIPDMRQGLVSVNAERTISEVGAKVLEGKLLPSGSVCVSCIATPGLVTLTSRKSFTNQQINSIVPAKSIYREFILFAMIQMGDLIGAAGSGGSVFANMNTGRFKELPLLRPIDEVLSAFSDICNPTMKKILSLQKEIDVIMKLRDTLLPKLMSGELRVKDIK